MGAELALRLVVEVARRWRRDALGEGPADLGVGRVPIDATGSVMSVAEADIAEQSGELAARAAGGATVARASLKSAPMSGLSTSRSTASVRSHWIIAVVLTVDGMVFAGSRWVWMICASGYAPEQVVEHHQVRRGLEQPALLRLAVLHRLQHRAVEREVRLDVGGPRARGRPGSSASGSRRRTARRS